MFSRICMGLPWVAGLTACLLLVPAGSSQTKSGSSGGGGGASMGSGGSSMGGGGSSMGSGGGGGGSAAGAGGSSMGGQGDKMGSDVPKLTNGLTKLGTGSGTTGSVRDANNTAPLGMAFNGSKASAFGNPIIGSQGGGGSSGQSRGKGGMTSGGRAGGSMRAGGMGGMGGSTPNGTMAGATKRTASYMTQPIFDSPVSRERYGAAGLVAPRVLNDVQGTFARSARFQGDSAITVLNQGSAIVLRGVVATDKERRVAESMVRMSPGVREVQNEIEVAGNPE